MVRQILLWMIAIAVLSPFAEAQQSIDGPTRFSSPQTVVLLDDAPDPRVAAALPVIDAPAPPQLRMQVSSTFINLPHLAAVSGLASLPMGLSSQATQTAARNLDDVPPVQNIKPLSIPPISKPSNSPVDSNEPQQDDDEDDDEGDDEEEDDDDDDDDEEEEDDDDEEKDGEESDDSKQTDLLNAQGFTTLSDVVREHGRIFLGRSLHATNWRRVLRPSYPMLDKQTDPLPDPTVPPEPADEPIEKSDDESKDDESEDESNDESEDDE